MPLAHRKTVFHWPDYDDSGKMNGKSMCGIDSANEHIYFVFGKEFQDAIEEEIKLDEEDMSDILCAECDKAEMEEVDLDGEDTFSEE